MPLVAETIQPLFAIYYNENNDTDFFINPEKYVKYYDIIFKHNISLYKLKELAINASESLEINNCLRLYKNENYISIIKTTQENINLF